ncbi:MAG: hypothetical protein JNJ77_04790 [Planctomycetia bacterium]|nr:hypothetical protein [Planctomycetia bacterium]
MRPPRYLLISAGLLCSVIVGCQSLKAPSWSSAPPRRSDDPLLCTDAERKRPRDLYATTSDSRYLEPVAAAVK